MKIAIKVGEHDVAVEVTAHADGVLYLVATCGETTRDARLTLDPKHDRTAEQMRNDVQELAQRLAEEAAGHEQSRKLMGDFFSGGNDA